MSAAINISSRRRQGRRVSARTVRAPTFTKAFRRRPNVFMRVPRQIVVRQAQLGEKKFFDNSFSTASTNAWAIITANLVIPGQGQTVETRIGDSISITSLNFRMFLSMPVVESAVVPSPVILTRVIIGISHVGILAAATDVVDTGATSASLAYYQNSTISDFTILKDFFIKVDPHALNEGAINLFSHGVSISDVVKFTHQFKKPLVMKFAAGTTTVRQNGFFVIAVSTGTGATQNIETRARYLDK